MHAVVVRIFPSQNVKNTRGSDRCWKLRQVHAVVARSTFPSQNVQDTPRSGPLGSSDVEKVHAVVVRIFPSQNVKNTRGSDRCWKLRQVHAVVARSTFPSQNVQDTPRSGPLGSSDVEKVHAVVVRIFPSQNVKNTRGSDRCRKLRQVHAVVARSTFPSQNVQDTPRSGPLGSSDVEKVHAVVVRIFPSQNVKNTRGSDRCWKLRQVHAVVARSTFPSQNVQDTPRSGPLGSSDVEKVHAVVVRIFPSQNVKNTRGSDRCWKLRQAHAVVA